MTTPSGSASWLSPRPPSVALEVASGWVSAVGVRRSRGQLTVTAHAVEPLPPGAVSPGLAAPNITDAAAVTGAGRRALERAGLGSASRAALVLPDAVARVSLLEFESLPTRARDLDRVVEWRLRKSVPFPLEQARVSHFLAHNGNAATLAATVVRRDVLAEYEAIATAMKLRAGLVDLASFNVINVVLTGEGEAQGDWLVVHLAPEATTIAIMRDASLMFYRQRATIDGEPLAALVHQTAMYHEDRLGGSTFTRVWLSGVSARAAEVAAARQDLEARLGVSVEPVDVARAASLGGRHVPSAADLDAIAAPIGILVRDGRGA